MRNHEKQHCHISSQSRMKKEEAGKAKPYLHEPTHRSRLRMKMAQHENGAIHISNLLDQVESDISISDVVDQSFIVSNGHEEAISDPVQQKEHQAVECESVLSRLDNI